MGRTKDLVSRWFLHFLTVFVCSDSAMKVSTRGLECSKVLGSENQHLFGV